MPGRNSIRTSTTSRSSRSSRASKTPRQSEPEVSPPDEGPVTPLRQSICTVFGDAQRSTAGHRKLVVNLRKIQEVCCYESSGRGNRALEGFEEDDFNAEIARCVIRIVPIKKSETVGDRLVRFLGQFLRHASDKDASLLPEQEVNDDQVFPEMPSTRLTSHIFSVLLPLLFAKEKVVRFRATQIISHMVNSLDSLDDEYYQLVRAALLKRIRDKESMVRVQAALGLGRLAGNEGDEEGDEDSDDDEAAGLLRRLLDVLQNDPSADVRRSLLLNLPLTPATLPYLLERARDTDASTRRVLYSRLLPALGDFRHLSLSMREKLLRWGLRDRDDNVRKATARIFRERWIEDCASTRKVGDPQPTEQVASADVDALLELLERIDVVNSGVDDGIALEALKEFWEGRPDYQAVVTFDGTFWDHLTSESVFLARSLNDFCHQEGGGKYEPLIEDKMPEVTKLAFILQRYANTLIDRLRRLSEQNHSQNESEEDTVEDEFIVEQLLHIALTLDYADEVGRRQMFALLREILAIAELPEEITRLAVECLRLVCSGGANDAAAEREFCGIVLEAIAEVHDTIAGNGDEEGQDGISEDPDDSFHSARSEALSIASTAKGSGDGKLLAENTEQDEEKVIKEIVVNMKCLHIAQCMLQNVAGDLKENVHLVTMLNNLVVPAVRSHEAPIRERGLMSLGLCCLLDKTLAEENLTLFLHCFNKGHAALQSTALQILADILTRHPSVLPPATGSQTSLPQAGSSTNNPSPPSALRKQVLKAFSKGLKASHTPDVQSTATTALCKLFLTRILTDADLLRQLVQTFFEPSTRDNAATRQALSYFLPAFAHSRRENMEALAGVAPAVMHAVVGFAEELGEEEEMVGAGSVGSMLVDWTDARKLVVLDDGQASGGHRLWEEVGKREVKAVNGDVHLLLAEGVLERAMGHSCSKEEKKALLPMLGKLYITPHSTSEKLHSVQDLANEAVELKIAGDATSRNALTKLLASVGKAIGDAGEDGKKDKGGSRKSMAQVDDASGIQQATAAEVEKADSEEARTEESEGQDEIKDVDMAGTEDSVLDELLEDGDE